MNSVIPKASVFTVRADINEATQPSEVSKQVLATMQPLIASPPAGYRIEMDGSIEEAEKANTALAKIFPAMVMLTALLGLAGTAPTLLLFNQPFGFNAILGLIGLTGILMRNPLILTGQIKENRAAGLDDDDAVIKATGQRTRPVILTAFAAVLAIIPLTHSVFWGSMAYTLIGCIAVGTVLILFFLAALYAAWFRIKPKTSSDNTTHAQHLPIGANGHREPVVTGWDQDPYPR